MSQLDELRRLLDVDEVLVLLLDVRDEPDFQQYHISGGELHLIAATGSIAQLSGHWMHSAAPRRRHSAVGTECAVCSVAA